MKKIIIIATTLVMLFVSTGCSKRDETYMSSIEKTYSDEMEKIEALSDMKTIEDLYTEFYGGPVRGLKTFPVDNKDYCGWVIRAFNPMSKIDHLDLYV